jgi:hypothetical protein
MLVATAYLHGNDFYDNKNELLTDGETRFGDLKH